MSTSKNAAREAVEATALLADFADALRTARELADLLVVIDRLTPASGGELDGALELACAMANELCNDIGVLAEEVESQVDSPVPGFFAGLSDYDKGAIPGLPWSASLAPVPRTASTARRCTTPPSCGPRLW